MSFTMLANSFKTYLRLLAKKIFLKYSLTLSWRRFLSYRNQYINLQNKSIDWFLHYRDLCPESVTHPDMEVVYSGRKKKSVITFMNVNNPLPSVVLAKSMLPPSVATFRNFSKSFNLCSKVFPLTDGSTEINSSATAFWIANIAL